MIFLRTIWSFVTYFGVVFAWAGRWCLHRWQYIGIGALVTGLPPLVVGLLVHWQVITLYPSLREWLGEPVNEAAIGFVYMIIASVGLGLLVFALCLIAAPSQIHREQLEKEDQLRAELEDMKAGQPRVEIEIDPVAHIIPDPSGITRMRMRLWNRGRVPVEGPVVRIRKMEALTSPRKNADYARQFNDVPLKFARPDTAALINPGDSVEVFVATNWPGREKPLTFQCYDSDWAAPLGTYRVTFVGSGKNAIWDEKVFDVKATKAKLTVTPV